MLIPFLFLLLLVLFALMLWRVRQDVRGSRAAAYMLLARGRQAEEPLALPAPAE